MTATLARPTYENAESLAREVELAKRVSRAWHVTMFKQPRRYEIDFAALRNNEVFAWIETKWRDEKFFGEDEYMLALSKYAAAVRYRALTSVPAFFVVQFGNREPWWREMKGTDKCPPLRPGGRTDRNDPEDREICAWFPMREFNLISLPPHHFATF